ncbi:MAG: PD40 domain-containing protein, partial [Chitinophagaceae bacterium]|nr:PD40 domain-containing protein [Chitinophagaceae bacterium]
MQKIITVITFFISIVLTAQSQSAYFLTYPTLTPDGQTVIFSFEGDLWKASVSNGQASRLTAMEGNETNPRVSPDGKWIAFTGRQYGNADVFIMPINGGEVKQITFHSGNDEVDSWSWDSKHIYFTSTRYSRSSGYKVSLNGGTPERVFGDNYFQYDHNLVEHPTSGEIFFNDTWESSNQAARKRYKGPFNPDIQSYNLKTKQHKKYTDWEGKDFSATIDKNGNIYFISDEANGEYNLYTLDNGKKKGLTKFSSSIKNPQVNANGGKVVFEKDYQLWMHDVQSGKESKLDIAVIRNNTLPKEKDFDVKGKFTAYDVSPDGKKLALVSRGELFVSDLEGKFIQQINRNSAERVKEVKWMSDNKTLLFNQTLDGYTNWYTIAADGNGASKQLTSDKRNNQSLTMNKKRTKAVYISGRDEVRMMDLKSLVAKTIIKDELWGFRANAPQFSPNDEYVLFAAYRNFEQDLFVYNVKENKTTNLTNTGITETGAIWSPDSKYIYFTSQRLKPSYPFGMPDAKVYRMALENMDDPYRIDKY